MDEKNSMPLLDDSCGGLRKQSGSTPSRTGQADRLATLLHNNRLWSQAQTEEDADFFARLQSQQAPEYLWIGCADSRVPANQIVNLAPGQVFVQRNVGNQALHNDLNCMSCLEYAVRELKVKAIMVCGHYGCGAVKAALTLPPGSSHAPMLVNHWITGIRDCRNAHREELRAMTFDQAFDRLCELNVLRQVFHVCTSPVVQMAWAEGQEVEVYGVVYSLKDGRLKRLAGPVTAEHHVDVSMWSSQEWYADALSAPRAEEFLARASSSGLPSKEASAAGGPSKVPLAGGVLAQEVAAAGGKLGSVAL